MKIPFLSDILDAIQRAARWLASSFKWWYGLILSFILIPVEWVLDWLHSLLDLVIEYWGSLDMVIQNSEIFSISGYWANAAPYLAKANAIVPINFIVGICAILGVLWVICAVVRLVITLIPGIG